MGIIGHSDKKPLSYLLLYKLIKLELKLDLICTNIRQTNKYVLAF